jgi:hypothetical protein
MKNHTKTHPLLLVLIGLMALDLGFLSWWMFFGGGSKFDSRLGLVERRLDSVIVREGYESELGDEVLVNKAAAEAVKSLKPELEAMNSPDEAVLGESDLIREYFVPLGSGQTSNTEWADVPSAQATINSDRYGEIVSIYFEASLSAINGMVEARILDKTTSDVIDESNISHDTSEYVWKISKPFTVGPGGKTYIVQMKSSTGETVEMSQARLKVLAREK